MIITKNNTTANQTLTQEPLTQRYCRAQGQRVTCNSECESCPSRTAYALRELERKESFWRDRNQYGCEMRED